MATLTAHRTETVIGENGELILDGLPFRAGETVEVIILPTAKAVGKLKRKPTPYAVCPFIMKSHLNQSPKKTGTPPGDRY